MSTETSLPLEAEQVERLNQFIGSKLFTCSSDDVAKSSYWQYHSKQLVTEKRTREGGVSISGESGFYVPSPGSFAKRLLHRAVNGIKQPSLISKALGVRFQARFGVPRLMSYYEAFDAAMSHDAVSDPDLSPWRVSHLKLASRPSVFPTSDSVAKHFQSLRARESEALARSPR